MVFKATDCSKSKKSLGESSGGGIANLSSKLNQLKKQIQAERIASIKEKVEKNKKELEGHVLQILSTTSNRNALCVENNRDGKMLSSRIDSPQSVYTGDKDYISGHEVISFISTRLPFVEKLPPYTTWIFLDRNQRMAEDQSVVGRRRIYYDSHGNEALLCSDSEDDVVEPEEEKHEFAESEDQILWAIFEEYGQTEEVMNALENFLGIRTSELQERRNFLYEKYSAQNIEDSGDSVLGHGISLDKSLSAALDSFDNLFCRRCLLFDCRLHGCSQPLIYPTEKQPYWSEYEEDRKPCSDHCYLKFRASKNAYGASNACNLHGVTGTNPEENNITAVAPKAELKVNDGDNLTHENEITEEDITAAPVSLLSPENIPGEQNLEQLSKAGEYNEKQGKCKALEELNVNDGDNLKHENEITEEITSSPVCLLSPENVPGEQNLDQLSKEGECNGKKEKRKAMEEKSETVVNLMHNSHRIQDFSSKKHRKNMALDDCTRASESVLSSSHSSVVKNPCKTDDVLDVDGAHISGEVCENESDKCHSENPSFPFNAASKDAEDSTEKEPKSSIEKPELRQSGLTWKRIERELYLKGVEIFGRNSTLIRPIRDLAIVVVLCLFSITFFVYCYLISGIIRCLIARNLLSGLKTCSEVSAYMFDNGGSTLQRSVMLNSEKIWKLDPNVLEQEMSGRPRLLRRKGRTRKLKYSWKSAGHPSMWKRMADGKNQSCKQYTPCGCQSTCGKQCPCLNNGTCCEKYCGCSKSCKNRFRGCHCAKSQCRSRQCPCFAAGRECDPDVCRNCWVSCGGGSFGEPPKRGDGQCGNMRLLLRQQQRILLAKSDVAGWGAFLKNSVNKNDYLGEYTGELISHREADKRGKIYDRANSSFLFDLNEQYVLDAYRKGDKLKFANHSSNPNCYAKVMLVAGDHRVGIFAKERIEASEELFYDYRYGPDQAPAWARKPEGSKRDDSSSSQGRAKKHQSH